MKTTVQIPDPLLARARGMIAVDTNVHVCAGILAALALCALVGCSTGSAPAGEPNDAGVDADASMEGGVPTESCPGGPIVIDPTAIIDDMEDRNGSLTAASGRNGGWWTAADFTPGGTLEPRDPLPERILGGRCGSDYAMRVTGQGFDEWGAILGMNFVYGSGGVLAFDASHYRGIRFWARIGDTSTTSVVFNVGDAHSAPEGGWCVEDGTPACFLYDVSLSQLDTTWKQYEIPFTGLVHQPVNGEEVPFDPSTLYTLTFYFPSASVFDFWVDDLEFWGSTD